MRWWEGYPGVSCTFCIDSSSIVTEDKVYYSNNPSKFLTLANGKNKVRTGSTQGPYFVDASLLSLKLKEYRSLLIKDTDLTFNTPEAIEDEFTIFLKCKVNQSTVFLCNSSSDHGPTFGVGLHNNAVDTGSDDWVWSCAGFLPTTGHNRNFFDIKTLVIKGKMSTKDVSFYTDFGIYKVPIGSTSFTSGFLVPRSYTTIGYKQANKRWTVNSDIIAYGIFNKILTDKQVEDLKSKVDSEFLISNIATDVENSFESSLKNLSFKRLQVKPTASNTMDTSFQTSKPVKNILLETTPKLESDVKVTNILYKAVKNISDVVLEEGLPIRTKLYLYEKFTGQLIKTTSSNNLGEFVFSGLEPHLEYIVRASDHKYQFKSILKDYNEE